MVFVLDPCGWFSGYAFVADQDMVPVSFSWYVKDLREPNRAAKYTHQNRHIIFIIGRTKHLQDEARQPAQAINAHHHDSKR